MKLLAIEPQQYMHYYAPRCRQVEAAGYQVYLLEIAARVGGGGLDEIARLTAGYDPIVAVAEIGCGVKPAGRHYLPTGTHITAMCLINEAGVIERIDVPDEVRCSDQVFLLNITPVSGDRINRPPNGNNILGFLGATGDSLEDAHRTMTGFADRIAVTFAEPAIQPATSPATDQSAAAAASAPA